MNKSLIACLLVLIAACGQSGEETPVTRVEPRVSELDTDKHLIFFRTSGYFDEQQQAWHLPIHGWVYKPQDSVVRKKSAERILETSFDLTVSDDNEENFSRRINLMVADNERGESIVINIAGRDFVLPDSGPNGHFEKVITLPAAEVRHHRKGGILTFETTTGGSMPRRFEGEVRLLGTEGISVISDIDDTVKLSEVGDHTRLLERAFLLDFEVAPGMSALYRDWAAEDVGFHYVSSSPWQLYTPLQEFLDEEAFPWASLSLKLVRFRDETFFDLFKKGTETKPLAIKKLLDQYPDRQFILVGDSGEQDPEVYADLIRERPNQILTIYIRNVTSETTDNERFTKVFAGVNADLWHLFDEPDDLPEAE